MKSWTWNSLLHLCSNARNFVWWWEAILLPKACWLQKIHFIRQMYVYTKLCSYVCTYVYYYIKNNNFVRYRTVLNFLFVRKMYHCYINVSWKKKIFYFYEYGTYVCLCISEWVPVVIILNLLTCKGTSKSVSFDFCNLVSE